MSGPAREPKAMTLMLVSAAVLVLFALAYPRTVPDPLLGSEGAGAGPARLQGI